MASFILVAILLAWFLFTFAFAFVGTSLEKAERLTKILWNGRINKMGNPPFSWFMNAYENKSYIKSFFFVLIFNAFGHVAMFLLGYIKIGLVMIIIQPFMQGALVGMGDEKTRLYGVITAVFEVSGFIISCSLGFFGAINYWWIPAIFLVLNALVEASGVLIGAQGVPGIEAVKNKQYK
ncbi:MAG: hypothetical protein AB2421_21070 [Thermotaleaceae bacterium]